VHGALGDDEPFGDGGVTQSLGHQGQHVAFPGGQPLKALVGAGTYQQLGDNLGIDGRSAIHHPVQRVQELLDPAYPLLEQIAQARAAVREQLGGERLLNVGREHEYGECGMPAPGLDRGADPVVGVRRRHPHIHDGHIGFVFIHSLEEVARVRRGGHHVQGFGAQQQGEALAQQRLVLGDHDPHGTPTCSTVGPPTGLDSLNVPSCASTRRRMPLSPDPPWASAPPLPSSVISAHSRSSCRRRRTVAWLAPLCLAMLVSASATAK
jgi:hypothetical protein